MGYDEFGIDGHKTEECFYIHKDFDNIVFNKSSFLKEWIDTYIGNNIKTIFDIGAFEGGDALRFTSWYPNADIYAIEASPLNYSVMNEKLGNKKPKIKSFNYAISDVNGQINFYNSIFIMDWVGPHPGNPDFLDMGSIYQRNDLPKKDTIIVESITFDTFCENNNIIEVDVAHIDVEGAGINVVLGMNKVLPKMIYTEKERGDIFTEKLTGEQDLINLLKDKGYRLEIELNNDYLFVLNSIK